MGRVIFVSAILASFGSAVFACGPSKKPPPKEPAHTETITDAGVEEEAAPPPKSLYEWLGKKEALTKEFRTMLVRTYSSSLTAYRNQNIEVKPAKMAPAV